MLNSKAFSEAAFCTLMAERFASPRHRPRAAAHGLHEPAAAHLGGLWRRRHRPRPVSRTTPARRRSRPVWLGVPVVSIADRPSVGRFGVSIAGRRGPLGLGCGRRDEATWRSPSPRRAIWAPSSSSARTCGIASRPRRLRDGKGLARDMEVAFRTLWNDWCENPGKERPSVKRRPAGCDNACRATWTSRGGLQKSAQSLRERYLTANPKIQLSCGRATPTFVAVLGRIAEAENDGTRVL